MTASPHASRQRFDLDAEGWFRLVGTVCLAVLLLVATLSHELWRDEAQAWWLARRAPSFWSLLTGEARRYEGHPFLWFWLLRLASKLSTSHLTLTFIATALALTNGWLLLGWRAFPRWQRALLALSYFPFFEYGVLSRSYGLALLFLLLGVRAAKAGPRGYAWLGVLGGLAANTALMAAIPAAVLIGNACAKPALMALSSGRERALPRWRFLVAPACFAGLLAFAVWTTPVPADAVAQLGPIPPLNVELAVDVGRRLFQALVPIPDPMPFDGVWWSSNAFLPNLENLALVTEAQRRTTAVFALVAYALTFAWLYALKRDRIAALGLGLGFALTLALTLRLPVRAVRYEGHLVLCLLVTLAVAAEREPSLLRTRPVVALLGLTFGAGVLGTAVATTKDFFGPFSQSLAVARYLEQRGAAALPIAGLEYHRLAPVAAYLDREFYSAEHERVISYGLWSTRWHYRRYMTGTQPVVRRAICWTLDQSRPGKPALLVASGRLGLTPEVESQLTLRATFAGSQAGEDYFVYEGPSSGQVRPPIEWCPVRAAHHSKDAARPSAPSGLAERR